MSEAIGKDVYTLTGKQVGRLTDLLIDVDSRLVSAVEMRVRRKNGGFESERVLVPYDMIVALDDIVLVGGKR
ncbi:MAG: PRC-barrel domain-containing protein [Candidatus Atabeyarchaeum deiterrae]